MGLIRRLRRGRDARAQFVSSHVDKTIAFQLRAIRNEQDLSQEQLAEMVEMNQNAISRLESEWYGKATISTLKRLAAALDVALVVRFVPFSQLIDWVSGTPFVDKGLASKSLAVPSFGEEENLKHFDQIDQITSTVATAASGYTGPWLLTASAGAQQESVSSLAAKNILVHESSDWKSRIAAD